MQKSVEKWQKIKTACKNTQSVANLAIIRGFLLNHQLNHLQDTFLCLWGQRVKVLGKLRRLVARRMIQNITNDRVSPVFSANSSCERPRRSLHCFTRFPIRLSIIARTYTFSITLMIIIWIRGIVIQKR